MKKLIIISLGILSLVSVFILSFEYYRERHGYCALEGRYLTEIERIERSYLDDQWSVLSPEKRVQEITKKLSKSYIVEFPECCSSQGKGPTFGVKTVYEEVKKA